jgi:hypothetical protein
MGIFNKLFGGDAGIEEAMYETYSKLKFMHPNLEEHEILALVLHHRFHKLQPDIALMIAVLFPRINILTEFVRAVENSGGPRYLKDFLESSTTSEERRNALNYIQKIAVNKFQPKPIYTQPNLKEKIIEDIVDTSAEVLGDKFTNKLKFTHDERNWPLASLSDDLQNTVANIYYRFFKLYAGNLAELENIEATIKVNSITIELQKDRWESQLEGIITLYFKLFPNKIVAEYAAINHALEWLEKEHQGLTSTLTTITDDILIAIFKYKIDINDAFNRPAASTVAECNMRKDEPSDEIPNLMHYFKYTWGYNSVNPY